MSHLNVSGVVITFIPDLTQHEQQNIHSKRYKKINTKRSQEYAFLRNYFTGSNTNCNTLAHTINRTPTQDLPPWLLSWTTDLTKNNFTANDFTMQDVFCWVGLSTTTNISLTLLLPRILIKNELPVSFRLELHP